MGARLYDLAGVLRAYEVAMFNAETAIREQLDRRPSVVGFDRLTGEGRVSVTRVSKEEMDKAIAEIVEKDEVKHVERE